MGRLLHCEKTIPDQEITNTSVFIKEVTLADDQLIKCSRLGAPGTWKQQVCLYFFTGLKSVFFQMSVKDGCSF